MLKALEATAAPAGQTRRAHDDNRLPLDTIVLLALDFYYCFLRAFYRGNQKNFEEGDFSPGAGEKSLREGEKSFDLETVVLYFGFIAYLVNIVSERVHTLQ